MATRDMTSTPGRDRDVVRARHHALGREVQRLLGRAALAIDRRRGHRFGPPGGEHRVAPDVKCLFTDLGDAPHDHVVDDARVEVVATGEGL